MFSSMLIDCDSCLAKDIACDDCVITVLFNEGLLTDRVVNLDQDEADALAALADAGLLPQLRLVPPSADTTVAPWKDSAAG
jgi:hypothetical protein